VASTAVYGAMQRVNAPRRRLVHVHIESRFVELNDVDAVSGESAGFGIEQVRKRHRHFDAVAVMGVGDRIDDGHRAGQGKFQFVTGMGAGDTSLAGVHAAAKAKLADDSGTHRFVAVVADAHFDPVREIDAVNSFEETVHEMLPRLLPIGDNVDAGIFL